MTFNEEAFVSDYFKSWKVQKHYQKLCRDCYRYEIKTNHKSPFFDQYGYIKNENRYIDVDELEPLYFGKVNNCSYHIASIRGLTDSMLHPNVMVARYPHIHMAYAGYKKTIKDKSYTDANEIFEVRKEVYFNTLFSKFAGKQKDKKEILHYINIEFPKKYHRSWFYNDTHKIDTDVHLIASKTCPLLGVELVYEENDMSHPIISKKYDVEWGKEDETLIFTEIKKSENHEFTINKQEIINNLIEQSETNTYITFNISHDNGKISEFKLYDIRLYDANKDFEDIKNCKGLQYIYLKSEEVLKAYGEEIVMNETNKKKIVFFTGSGISQESGIPTFRDNDGLWEQYPVELVASTYGWVSDPTFVNGFYNKLRQKYLNIDENGDFGIKPNSAHKDIVNLSIPYTGNELNPYTLSQNEVVIITQNVDDLHERALKEIDGISSDDITIPENPNIPSSLTDKNCDCGCYDNNDTGLTIPDDYELSKYKSPNTNIKIIHLHGELMKMCVDGYKENSEYHIQFPYKNKFTLPVNTKVKDIFPKTRGINETDDKLEIKKKNELYERIKNKRMRPYIVFFGEDVPNMSKALNEVLTCDMFVVIGTSLQVYPAASLLEFVPSDVPIVYIDPNPDNVGKKVQIIKMSAKDGMKELISNWSNYMK